eukprot:g35105.t1
MQTSVLYGLFLGTHMGTTTDCTWRTIKCFTQVLPTKTVGKDGEKQEVSRRESWKSFGRKFQSPGPQAADGVAANENGCETRTGEISSGEVAFVECYDLFNLLGLRIAYVTSTGRLVGVVALKE